MQRIFEPGTADAERLLAGLNEERTALLNDLVAPNHTHDETQVLRGQIMMVDIIIQAHEEFHDN
jgi:hypothetical protein